MECIGGRMRLFYAMDSPAMTMRMGDGNRDGSCNE